MSSRTILIFGIILAIAIARPLSAGVIITTTWDGSSSTDWDDPTNWSNGVPDANKDAIIVFATNQPVINMGTANKAAQALIMNSAAGAVSLTISSGFSLTVQKVDTSIGASPGSNATITINGVLTIDAGIVYTTSSLTGTANGTTDFGGTGTLTSDTASILNINAGTGASAVSVVTMTTALTGTTAVLSGELEIQTNAAFGTLKIDSSNATIATTVTVGANKNITVANFRMIPDDFDTVLDVGAFASVTVTASGITSGGPSQPKINGTGIFRVDVGVEFLLGDDFSSSAMQFNVTTTQIFGQIHTSSTELEINGGSDASFFVSGGLFGLQRTTIKVDSSITLDTGGQIDGLVEFENNAELDIQTQQNGTELVPMSPRFLELKTLASSGTPAKLSGSGVAFGAGATVLAYAGSDGNAFRIGSSFTSDGSIVFDGRGADLVLDLHNGAQLQNGGTMSLSADDGGHVIVSGTGLIFNEAGATFTSASVAGVAGFGGEGEGEVAQDTGEPNQIQTNITNEGMLLIDGELALANNFIQSASTATVNLDPDNGARLIIAGGSGTATFNDGALSGVGTIQGNLINGAMLKPGGDNAIGTITVNGNFTQIENGGLGTLELDFSSNVSYDRIVVTGNATVASQLSFNLIGSYASSMPPAGTLFTNVVAASGTRSGNFTVFAVSNDVFTADRYFNPEYVGNNVNIVFRSYPIPQPQGISVTTGTPFSGTLTSSDADNDSPLFTIHSQPTKGTATLTNSSTGAFTYTANADATGMDTFAFGVFDGASNSKFNAVVTVTLASGAPAPVISSVTATPDVALLNAAVVFSVSVTDPSSLPLTYLWDFKDGSAVGTTNPVSHAFAAEGTYAVSVTVSNGASIATSSVSVQVLPPNSGGEAIINVGDGKPPVSNPLSGITLKVTSSNGGVVELAVDLDALIREEFDVNTAFDTIKGRQNVRKGLRPTEKFVEPGVAVATTVATDAGTPTERGKARRQIAISSREVGQTVPFTAPPVDRTIENKSMKGKFLFSSTKPDQFTFTGMFELPAGLDLSQDRTLEIGIGNVVDSVTISAKGKSSNANKNRISKAQLKYPKLPKGSSLTVAGQKATLTLTMKGVDFSTQGFDTEGIAATLRGDEVGQKSVDRAIQTAISFAGSTWEGSIPVEFKLTKTADSGTIQNRRAN